MNNARNIEFSEFPIIETERILLREMTPDDATVLLKLFGNPEVVKFLEMNPLRTISQANEWLKWMKSFFASRGGIRWVVVLKDGTPSGTVIGSAGLGGWDREANCAQIGYDIAQQYWRQGYGTEVARALIEFGWNRMHLNRIEADIEDGNHPSEHILAKLGFEREGVLRQRICRAGKYTDKILYGLLRQDYMNLMRDSASDADVAASIG